MRKSRRLERWSATALGDSAAAVAAARLTKELEISERHAIRTLTLNLYSRSLMQEYKIYFHREHLCKNNNCSEVIYPITLCCCENDSTARDDKEYESLAKRNAKRLSSHDENRVSADLK